MVRRPPAVFLAPVFLALAFLALAFALPVHTAQAQETFSREVIRNFDTRIVVERDGSVQVTEDIEVVALGHEIRRGIFRDIPLGGSGLLGLGRAPFELLETLRDGSPEPYRIESLGGYVRIYLGDADVFLEPGVYHYRIAYRMGDQTRRFETFDEIYWNATGNEWAFPIEQARAVVVPPPGAPVSQLAAYTGYSGASGEDVSISETAAGEPLFRTTRPLSAGEGLTVAVGWPPGYLGPESASQRLTRWLERWGWLAAAIVTLGVVSLYYLLVWVRIGRDPPAGPIIPVYHPAIPPAAMRSIERMGFDNVCVAAAIISLAVKGYLRIEEESKVQTLVALPDSEARAPMSAGEEALYDRLFANGDEITIRRSSRARLNAASQALRTHFRKTYDQIYFRRNFWWFALGVVVTVVAWLVSAVFSIRQIELFFIALFPTIFGVVLGIQLVKAWRSLRDYRSTGNIVELVGAALQIVFIGATTVVIAGFAFGIGAGVGVAPFLSLIGVAALNVLFWNLLKVRTAIGREAMDEIEGTRLYLTVAEKDRLRFEHPPEKTPEHFHELLPYAIALGVETEWTNQFAAEIEAAQAADTSDPYLKPSWYSSSRSGGFGNVRTLRSFGSGMSSAFSAATVSRSSGSSGSSGGGSSGGGGGGGGGGGW